MKKWLIGALAGSTLFLASCGSPEVASTSAGRIRQDEFHERLKTMPTQTGGTYGEQILQQMIIEDVLAEGYADQVSDEEIQAEMDKTVEAYGGQEQFEQVLSMSNMDESMIEDTVRTNLYMREAIKDQEDINEEDVKTFYEEQIPEGTRVAHILVEDEEQANNLIDELNNGADFATLAEEHSMDPGSASNGGEYELQSGQMVPEFEEAAMGLEEGEITEEPVQTQNGYHVIKMLEKPEKQPYEEVKDQALDDYVMTQLATDPQVVNGVVTTLVQNANVQISDEDLQGAVAAFVEQPEEASGGGSSASEGSGSGESSGEGSGSEESSGEGSGSEESSSEETSE